MRRAVLVIAVFLAVVLLLAGLGPSRFAPRTPTPPEPAGATGPAGRDEDGAAERPEPLPEPGGEEVTIRVLARGSGTPLAGAAVVLGAVRGSTGRDGTVRLGLRTAGDRGRLLPFRATAAGHRAAAGRIAVPEAGELVLLLEPAGASVVGVVLSPGGEPLPGAVVECSGIEERTRADGTFGPIPVATGYVRLDARHPDFAAVTDSFPVAGGEVGREIVLATPTFARGRVVDGEGEPVAGVDVHRFGDLAHTPGGAVAERMPIARTGADGTFRLPLLRGETVEVELVAPGFADPERIHELIAGEESEIRLWSGATVTGRVLAADGTGVAGIVLHAFHEDDGYAAEAVTGPNGAFRLDPLRPGRQLVRAALGGTWATEWTVVAPRAGPVDGVELVLPPPRTVRGRVVDAVAGAPLAGVMVGVPDVPPGAPRVRTGPDGSFRLDLPIDESCHAVRCSFASPEHVPLTTSVSPDPAKPSTVRLVPAGRVRLRVVDAAGRPAAGARIRYEAGDSRFDGYAGVDGRAERLVAAGPVRVVATGAEAVAVRTVVVAAGASVDLGDLPLAAPQPGVDVLVVDPEGRPIPEPLIRSTGDRLVVGAPGFESRSYVPGETIVLRPTDAISGVVVDERGAPVPRAEVRTGAPGEWAPTDGRGRFRIEEIPEGVVRVLRAGPTPGHLPSSRRFARAGEDGVRLVSPRAAVLSLVGPAGDDEVAERMSVRAWLPALLDEEEQRPHEGEPLALPDGARAGFVVPAGEVLLEISRSDHPPLVRTVLTEAGRVTALELGFIRPGAVDGIVLDPAGRPVQDAEVSAILPSEARFVGTTDAAGRIRTAAADGVPNGRMRLLVEKDGFAPAVTEAVDLGAGASVTVRLAPGGTIAGRVFLAGEPAPDVDVRLLRPLREAHGGFEFTDADGRFTLPDRVPDGPARIELRAPGRLPVLRDLHVHDGETTELSIDLP